jgi:Tfp pilus assembly protein PilO
VISIPFARDKALRWAVAGASLLALVWYAQRYRPASAAVLNRETAVAAREARVQSARAAIVVLGQAGLDSLVEQFRADSTVLATRIPAAGAAGAVAAEVKEALSRAERQFGVRIAASEPLAPATEGAFHGGGYTVTVVGRYADIGALLASVASMPRVTRIRGLRLHAIPDSLIRSATPYGAASPTQTDSAGAATALADAGEAPFRAVATFSLVWYTLPSGPTSGDTVVAPSSFVPGVTP